MEAMISWVSFLIAGISSVCLLTYKEGRFGGMTKEQEEELRNLTLRDAEFSQIAQRKKELKKRKEIHAQRHNNFAESLRRSNFVLSQMRGRGGQTQLVSIARDGLGRHQ